MILLAIGPPVLASAWFGWQQWQSAHEFDNELPTESPVAIVRDNEWPREQGNGD